MKRDGFRVALQNPSPYPRGGLILAAWQEIAGRTTAPPAVTAVDRGGRRLLVQLDRLDPEDPRRDQLVLLHGELPPGDEHYRIDCGIVELRESRETVAAAAHAEAFPMGVRLRNETVDLWLQLAPQRDDGMGRFFGGSMTSVFHKSGLEMLDPIASELHLPADPEKRAMQIDRARFVVPAAGGTWSRGDSFFNQPWRLLSTTSGPIRATATIASPPLHYELPVRGTFRPFTCSLRRVVSVYAHYAHVSDEVWAAISPADQDTGEQLPEVELEVRYFMAANFGLLPSVFRYPRGPGWFTLTGDRWRRPGPGYAFATNADVVGVENPPPDFPDRLRDHTAFAWDLTARPTVRSFHLFQSGEELQGFQDLAGRTWYDFAFKPLRMRAAE